MKKKLKNKCKHYWLEISETLDLQKSETLDIRFGKQGIYIKCANCEEQKTLIWKE